MRQAAREVTSAVLLAGGPLLFVAGRALQQTARAAPGWAEPLPAAAAGALLAAAAAAARWPAVGRWLATVALGAFALAAAPALADRPAVTLCVGVLWLGALSRVWARRRLRWQPERALLVAWRAAAVGALVTWALTAASRLAPSPAAHAVAAAAQLVAIVFLVRWLRTTRRGPPAWLWVALVASAVLALAAWSTTHRGRAVTALAIVPLVALPAVRDPDEGGGWSSLIAWHPARLVVVTFVVLCAAGTFVVGLPLCSTAGGGLELVDSAFTAVSAVCVTGLIVVDTPHAFTGAGQLVVLVLIQLGALGIMSLSTAALGLLGRRLSLRHEAAVADIYAAEHRGRVYSALGLTLRVTLLAETAGAALLIALFAAAGEAWPAAAWRGVFTSVSAFCNAGFALQSDSLIPYQRNPAILGVVGALIVCGGLSPVVIAALPLLWRRQRARLQVRIVVLSTAVLLAIGFLGYAALEWEYSLAGLPVHDRIVNAAFQSITLRTAGFNSVEMGEVRLATLPLMAAMMFIGGAPGGTAGGIKVTTAWVLLLAVLGTLRGSPQAVLAGKRIPHRIVYEAAAITVLGLGLLATLLVAVLLTQRMPARMAAFEIVSALGTVGLSLGGTQELDGVGKGIVMVAMFVGRVGPLTAFVFLSERATQPRVTYPEEEVEVG